MTDRRPGQWPTEPTPQHDRTSDEATLYEPRQQERALHEMVLDSIRHDLQQQPSPFTVVATARNWCNRITAAAEEIAKTKRRPPS